MRPSACEPDENLWPEAPTPSAVRTYLREFLSDPRVVEIPRAVWWLILNLFILPFRPKESAKRYAQVWTAEGSPLKLHTERQARLLRGYLGESIKAPLLVEYAMRYGSPSISDTLDRMKAAGCTRILAVPLYPQYAASTTAKRVIVNPFFFRKPFRRIPLRRNPCTTCTIETPFTIKLKCEQAKSSSL